MNNEIITVCDRLDTLIEKLEKLIRKQEVFHDNMNNCGNNT